ncbi:hypothetical protein KQ875_00385 [Mycoplasma zalophi]|uniref:ECM-binding protein homolog n=1 Tax=Mycoplasma zalophi TaxID=191287 RepID=A0ABS6DP03_9MOLU|nr:hypothetical protein [Mycoplasma zalophi]MBU4692055.1 hypothetical protein [Mycoplasma zalophi]
MSEQKTTRDNTDSTTDDIISAKNKLIENNNELKTNLENVVSNFNEYKDKFKEALDYKNKLSDDQDEAKKILADALEAYKQSNISNDDILNPTKYEEFKNKLDKAINDAKSVETSKNNYKIEKDSIVADSDFNNYPKALEKYKEAVKNITGDNGSLKQALAAAKTPEEIKKAYDDATEALKQAKNDIALNKAEEDYLNTVDKINKFKEKLNDKDANEKAIIDALDKAKEAAKNAIDAKTNTNPPSVTIEDYNTQKKNLEDVLLKAKLDKSKNDYEKTKQQAEATSNELEGNYPETKEYYDGKLGEIQKELDEKLKKAEEDKQKQKEAYDAAKEAIEALNETLEAKKQEELDKNKAEYEESVNEFEKTLQEAENIGDKDLKNEIKTLLEKAKEDANNILKTEPLTAAKYAEAKKILDDANKLAKTKEFDKLKEKVEEYINSDLNNDKYSEIKSNLESTKNTQNGIVHPGDGQDNPSPKTIKEAIEALKDAFDNAKKQKAQKDFDDEYNTLRNKGANEAIQQAIEKAVSDQKAVRDNTNSTTEEIKTATDNLKNQNIADKITQANDAKTEYEKENDKVLSGDKLNEKFGDNEEAKQKYLDKVSDIRKELETALNSKDKSLESIKSAYDEAKSALENTNSDANIQQEIAADKYRKALRAANDKKTSLNDSEESKIKKDLGDVITPNTIEESAIDSTPTSELETKTKALNDAVKKANQEQEQMRVAKAKYDAKVSELESAKNTYPSYSDELQTAINSSNSSLSTKQTNKTIEPTDYDAEVTKLQSALDKVKAKDNFDKEYNSILNAVTNDAKYSAIKSAVISKLKPQKDIKDNANSTVDQINKATSDLQKNNTIATINSVKSALNNLISKENELKNSKTNTYNGDEEIKKYIDSIINNNNNLHTSITGNDSLSVNSYTDKQTIIEKAIQEAQNIKNNKNTYSSSLSSLESEINKITGSGSQKSKELLNAEKQKIIDKLNSDITSANNDPKKLKDAYSNATTSLNNLKDRIDWYKAIGEYERKREEVENYKNSLTGPQYNKVKNVDLTNAISNADTEVNRNNNYNGRDVTVIRSKISSLQSSKEAAEAEVASINTNKQAYDATVTKYNTFKNDTKYAEYKSDLETFLSNKQNSLTEKQNNNTILSTDFSAAKSELENKMREVSALRYQKLSQTVEGYVNNTLTSDYYKDLRQSLASTKNTEDSISLPNHNPTQQQSERSYSRLDAKFNDTKTRKQSRDTVINQMNTAKLSFEKEKSKIASIYNRDINIDDWSREKLRKIEETISDAITKNTLSDQTFINAKQKYDNLEKEAYQEIAKQITSKINQTLSDPKNDRIVESQSNYSRLSELKTSLSTIDYNNSNYSETIKNIYDEAIQNIQTIENNKKEYEKEHKLAVENLERQKAYKHSIDNAVTNLVDVSPTWGKSLGSINRKVFDRDYALKTDKDYFKSKQQIAADEIAKLEAKVNSKSIEQNKIAKNEELSNTTKIDSDFMLNNLDGFVTDAKKFITEAGLNDPKNGFKNRTANFNAIKGFTRLESTRDLYGDLQNRFINTYQNNDRRQITIEDYVNHRNMFYNSVNSYEQEMYKLKDILKKYVEYKEDGTPGEYVQAFRELYGYLPLVAGYKTWNDQMKYFYNNLLTATYEYKQFDDFKVILPTGIQKNIYFSDIYEDIVILQKSDLEARTTKPDESIYKVIEDINIRKGNLTARYFNQIWKLQEYSQYYWKNKWNVLKLKGDTSNTYYVFNEYVRKMIYSFIQKLPNEIKNDNSNNQLFNQLKAEADKLPKEDSGIDNSRHTDYQALQAKINDVIRTYFKAIDKYYKPKSNGEYKQLLFWDGTSSNADSTKINAILDYYEDSGNAGLKMGS